MTHPLLVWIGPLFFVGSLKDLGWQVVRIPYQQGRALTWQDILNHTGGQSPDMVVVADMSLPPHVLGMEAFPCLTVFYAVDSHIHSWYPIYAQGFDFCMVSLRDHLPRFMTGRHTERTVWWSPPFARDTDRPPEPEHVPVIEWPVLFVGTVDRLTTPERFEFMNRLKKLLPSFHYMKGVYADLYPKSLVVLNECSQGDLNFRVFEALACGKCLVTPKTAHGLDDLFTHGIDLFMYPQGDAEAAAEIAAGLLQDPQARERAAASGLRVIDSGHRSIHRARDFTVRMHPLIDGPGPEIIRKRLSVASEIRQSTLKLLYLHHAQTQSSPELRQAYLNAATGK